MCVTLISIEHCRRRSEGFEPQHWPSASLHETMILFHDFVQVFRPDHLDPHRTPKSFQHLVYGFGASGGGPAFVDNNLARLSVYLKPISEE